jgi:hypothetical protein
MKDKSNFFSITRTAGLLAILSSLVIGAAQPTLASSSVSYKSESISYNGKTFALQMVTVDLKDPYLRVMPATAKDGIGHVEEFSSMLTRNHAVAGVNGTFFDAYVDNPAEKYPNGLMIRSGEIIHSGANQTLSVKIDKLPEIEYIQTMMKLVVTREDSSTYTFHLGV